MLDGGQALLTVPPRWSKLTTNVQGRGKGRWKVMAVPAANRGRVSVGGTFSQAASAQDKLSEPTPVRR